MAVKDTLEGKVLHLLVDNGDLDKLDDALNKWGFKDYQSLMRFCVSVLLLAEDNSIGMKTKGTIREIQPAADLLQEKESHQNE
jgi:hypothetical protein